MTRPRWSPPPAPIDGLGRLLSAAEAQRLLGINASTVRTWHQRCSTSGLYSAGLDGSGRPLFYEADLVALQQKRAVRDELGERIHTLSDLQGSQPRPAA